MKKILIPTDFSDNANDALEYVIASNKDQLLDLKIIHVIDISGKVSEAPMLTLNLIKTLTENATKELAVIKERITQNNNESHKSWSFSSDVLIGNPVSQILEQAKNFDADLIVLGNKGENFSISDKITGITSLKLTKEAQCPVLLVPKDFKFEGMDSILFPTNLEYSDPYILWKSMKIISPFKPVIRCLHINSNYESEITEQAAFGKYMVDNSPSIQTIFHLEEGDNTDSVIHEFCDTFNCQMIIMHKAKRSFLDKLFSKSLTRQMRRHVNLPLLIMNNKS